MPGLDHSQASPERQALTRTIHATDNLRRSFPWQREPRFGNQLQSGFPPTREWQTFP